MKKLSLILITAIILYSCSKESINEPIAKKVFRISKRYTNPPDLDTKGNWKPYAIVTKEIIGVGYEPYQNVKPDTLISVCSIDKIDSSFKIEIRSFVIK